MRTRRVSRFPFLDLNPGLMLIGLAGLVVAVGFWSWPEDPCPGCDHPEEPVRTEAPASAARSVAENRLPPSPGANTEASLPGTAASGDPTAAGQTPETAAQREERRLLNRLRQQGVPAEARGQLRRQEVVIAPDLMSHLTDSSNWMPELMKASSSVRSRQDGEPTRLALDRVEADSILWELGLQEGDVIVLVQGKIPHFSPTHALDYIRQADAALAAFDQGEPITLTVLRRGQPVHLVYQPW
ncbi:MAG: hypothetical protein EOM92_15865 [Gammaproteobacteria bacterium]|nr:hypothetical protein [Gammaproteobacteria bacterium]